MATSNGSVQRDALKLVSCSARRVEEAVDHSERMVTIFVAAILQAKFYVNERLICGSSQYFAEKQQKNASQHPEHDMIESLPKADPSDFNVYVNWLYTGQVFLGPNADESPGNCAVCRRLINVYLLGKELRDPGFQDAVTDMMVSTLEQVHNGRYIWPDKTDLRMLYRKTKPGDAARKLFTHIMKALPVVRVLLKEHESLEELPEEYLGAVSRWDLQRRVPQTDADAESTICAAARCAFHVHDEYRIECYREKYGLVRG